MTQSNDQPIGTESPESTQNQPSMRQRVEVQRGVNVPIDYFLYSCLEHERTKRAAAGTSDEASLNMGRWPIMVGATLETLPVELSSMELRGLLSRMSLWYAAQYPEMVEETPLDHVMLNQIVDPFMKFTLDLADLVLLKTGTPLPSHNADTSESLVVWEAIKHVLKDDFPGYHAYFDRFLRWAFADVEPEEIEEGSRPPVGKNMPNFRGNRPQGPSAGGRHHNASNGAPRHNQNHNHSQGQNRDHRPRDNNRPHRDQGKNFGQAPQQGDRHQAGRQRPTHTSQQADAEVEKLALASVDEAIAKINSGSVEEVFLKPMNSFYRRIQHQYAVDKGYESCSVGEGNERGVKVSKKL